MGRCLAAEAVLSSAVGSERLPPPPAKSRHAPREASPDPSRDTLGPQVTLHLQRKLASPVRVHLSSTTDRTTHLASLVESGGPLGAVMELLSQHGLAPAGGGFVTGPGCVVVKRGDGTTYSKLLACESDTVGWLLDRLQQLEVRSACVRWLFVWACLPCGGDPPIHHASAPPCVRGTVSAAAAGTGVPPRSADLSAGARWVPALPAHQVSLSRHPALAALATKKRWKPVS